MELHRLIIFLAIIICQHFGFSQSQMGIVHDNINVTEGIRLNPARAVDPRPWLDIHVGGLYFFGASNGAYLAAEEFSPLSGKFPSQISQNYNIDKVDGQIEGFALGPAMNISLGKFSLGLSSAFRNYAIGRNIPLEFTRGLIYGLQIPDYYGQRLSGGNYRTKALSFIEVGMNGGMIAHQKGNILVNVGINFKYMLGIGGIDFLVDDFNYEMIDSTNAFVYNYTGKYGGADFGFHPGVGYGADLGVTLEKKVAPSRHYTPHSPQSNCKYVDYVYRLGFSILDIGAGTGIFTEVLRDLLNEGSVYAVDKSPHALWKLPQMEQPKLIIEDANFTRPMNLPIFDGLRPFSISLRETHSRYSLSWPLYLAGFCVMSWV